METKKQILSRGWMGLALIASLFCTACAKKKNLELGDLSDPPPTAQALFTDLAEQSPAYGIVIKREEHPELEVNIEAEDSPKVAEGQNAVASIVGSSEPVRCRVSKILRAVSAETGQSIAWLRPLEGKPLPIGEFVSAKITTRVRNHVLVVPRMAVFIRDGRSMAIRQEKTEDGKVKFEPVEVQTGSISESTIEIKSGLKPQDTVVTEAGIGFLYPDFKASQEE